jgi:hypothetical protein
MKIPTAKKPSEEVLAKLHALRGKKGTIAVMKTLEVKRPSKEVLAKVHSLKGKKGMLAMIEPESGEWFLGKNVLEALKKAKKRYPDKIFYCIRIGSPFAHGHRGGIGRI